MYKEDGNMHKSNKIALVIASIFILNSLLIINNNICRATGDTLWVDDDFIYPEESDGSLAKPYKYIHSAISAADDGDTIAVLPGEYAGDLVIDKSIKLTTQDSIHTKIISGSKNTYLIEIKTDNVSIERFTINDTTQTSHRKAVIHVATGITDVAIIENNIGPSNNGFGIHLEGTYSAVVKNNFITGNKGIYIEYSDGNSIYGNSVGNCTPGFSAINLYSSDNNLIENNIFRNSTNGISTQSCSNTEINSNTVFCNDNNGMAISVGSGNIIFGNRIYDNNNYGLGLSSSQSSVYNNSISSNRLGISLSSSNCNITNNNIYGSETYSIYTESGSINNKIYANTFTYCYGITHAKEEGNNHWDYGNYGNYWDDYYGPDNDGDGFGDIPYTLGGVEDDYPTGVFQEPPTIVFSTAEKDKSPNPSHLEDGVALQPTLSVKVKDPEGERMDVYFYYLLNNESTLIEVVKDVESEGFASIPFFSTIQGENAVYTYIGHGYDYIGVWYVVVKDQYSEIKSPEWIFTTRHVPIDNEKPTANAGGPYSGQINETITFDGTNCYDSDGTIEFYRWSFGDNTSVTNVQSPTHKYSTSGRKQVSLIVIDDQGSSNTHSTYVDIEVPKNDPPIANAGGPYTVIVDGSINFFSTGSYDPDPGDMISSYNWYFGDNTNSTDANPIHIYSTPGNYTVTLVLMDAEGLEGIDSTYVLVTKSDETPGFEIIILLISLLLVIFIKFKKRNQ